MEKNKYGTCEKMVSDSDLREEPRVLHNRGTPLDVDVTSPAQEVHVGTRLRAEQKLPC